MIKPGTPIIMGKGYRGIKGVVTERTESQFEFYVVKLENDISLVAGPTAFDLLDDEE